MRRNIIPWLLSMFLIIGSGTALADNHRGDRGKPRTEQRNNTPKKNGHHNKKEFKKNQSKPRPGSDSKHNISKPHMRPGHHVAPPPVKHHYRPTPPPPRRHHYAPAPPLPAMLSNMVAYATRGCSNVDVWQIDPETFIVKYRHGGRYYTQMLYPYAEQYGPRNSISVNWQPSNPWTLIPSINLNINL